MSWVEARSWIWIGIGKRVDFFFIFRDNYHENMLEQSREMNVLTEGSEW